MGDILSKLQMVSEKIGVTETAHTIEEQVDLISESLDKIPHSTNIAEALDDLSEVAQNINNEEVYVDKTITENGTYLPADDEATAYSKVVVDVDTTFTNMVSSFMLNNDTEAKRIVFMRSDNGVYDIPAPTGPNESTPSVWVLVDPVVSFKMQYPGGSVTFTPADNFDNIYGGNDRPVSYTGDTLVPGDGKTYSYRPSMGGDTLKKSSYDFYFSIT